MGRVRSQSQLWLFKTDCKICAFIWYSLSSLHALRVEPLLAARIVLVPDHTVVENAKLTMRRRYSVVTEYPLLFVSSVHLLKSTMPCQGLLYTGADNAIPSPTMCIDRRTL